VQPETRTAMRLLIAQVRAAMAFDAPDAMMCTGTCDGCSAKLLEFLDTELHGWEQRLDAGERPNLGDVSRLAETSRQVYAILQDQGVVAGQSRAASPTQGCTDRPAAPLDP
jgi:hypothetical protein